MRPYLIIYEQNDNVVTMVRVIHGAREYTQPPTTTLYRPVGRVELELIKAAELRQFPPRLPSQPIFYPVLNLEYARQIARDWNTRDEASGFEGHVLRFRVRKAFLDRYDVQRVGGAGHDEYWIPAEDLDEFNRNIEGLIEIVESFDRG